MNTNKTYETSLEADGATYKVLGVQTTTSIHLKVTKDGEKQVDIWTDKPVNLLSELLNLQYKNTSRKVMNTIKLIAFRMQCNWPYA